MDAGQLFKEGKLEEAIALLNEEVRSNPTDTHRRSFLSVLLCFHGDLDRADRQLEALIHQDPDAAVGISLMRHLVRAAQWRQQFHEAGRLPEFLEKPGPQVELHLKASVLMRDAQTQEAARVLEMAEEERPPLSGTLDGQSFDDFRDLDDLMSGFFEVLTSTGKFYWIPCASVSEIQFHEPERPRDLLWRRATMDVREGPEGDVYIPAIYPSIDGDADEAHLLGRATDWTEGDVAPVRGVGLRTFLVGEETRTILELGELHFSSSEAGGD